MIIACPACATRFLVDDAALGAAGGRRLRCAACGYAWHYRPASTPALAPAPPIVEPVPDTPPVTPLAAAATATAAEPVAAVLGDGPNIENAAALLPSASETIAMEALAAVPDTSAPPIEPRIEAPIVEPRIEAPMVEPATNRLRTEPVLGPAPPAFAAAPRASIAVEQRPAAGGEQSWALAGGLGLAALAAAVLLVAIFARDEIMAIWPSSIGLYSAVGLAGPLGAGLEIKLMPSRLADSLIIDGDIVNSAAVSRRIPRLRVTLRDEHKTALASRIVEPPVAQLAPGETAHFATVFDHPSASATGVAVTFATD